MNEIEDDEAMDIAATMGFTTFGAKPGKKRKFNPGTDAATDAPELSNLGAGSGSNATPLGTQTARGAALKQRTVGAADDEAYAQVMDAAGFEEVEDPEHLEETPPDSLLGSGGVGTRSGNNQGQGGGKGTGESAVIASQSIPGHESPPQDIGLGRGPGQGKRNIQYGGTYDSDYTMSAADSSSISYLLPARFPVAASSTMAAPHTHGPGNSQVDAQQLRRGIRNERGDIAYYDPSFVENPWKEIEDQIAARDAGAKSAG
ncbi:MAG: hypothetical protein M1827_007101 [Pycnora praestabilis]|nr:MAG: hypothetical protein M1827_007101 [Pycnora praestabilis]